MNHVQILILNLVLGTVACGMIAKFYVMPALASRTREKALQPLVLLHCFRYIGLVFLVSGVVAPELPRAFAVPAAYGDLLTSVLALLAVVALRSGWGFATCLVWIFNCIGSVDAGVALTQFLRLADAGQLGGAYFIPSLIVPALIVTHWMIFKLLLRKRK